jgi:hypothetical protein
MNINLLIICFIGQILLEITENGTKFNLFFQNDLVKGIRLEEIMKC